MTTPTSSSLSLPAQANNNLNRVSPLNVNLPLEQQAQSPSINATQFLPPQQHAGPSSFSHPLNPQSHSSAQKGRPPMHQQPIAGPSRPPPHQQPHNSNQFQQQFNYTNGSPAGGIPQQGGPQTFNSADPSLHARLLMAAQQQAQAAAAANAAKANSNGSGSGTTDGRPPRIPPDLAALASNMQGGNREAIMKQLQALQNSQAQRAKLALANPGGQISNMNGSAPPHTSPSPANMTAPSPIAAPSPITASSPANTSGNQMQFHSQNQPSNVSVGGGNASGQTFTPQPNSGPSQSSLSMDGQNYENTQSNMSGLGGLPGPSGEQMSQQQRDFLQVQQERMRVAQQIQMHRQQNIQQQGGPQQTQAVPPAPGNAPHPGQLSMPSTSVPSQPQQGQSKPPGPGPIPGQPGVRPPINPVLQRQTFLNSVAQFYKQTGQSLPPAIFNGERDGAFKLGEGWVDVVELMMAVMRCGGIMNAMQQPLESPLWSQLVQAKGISSPLNQPVLMPKLPNSDPNAPPQLTTNPVQYIVAMYFAWLHPFETHMTKQRQHAAVRQQALAAGRPMPPGAMNAVPFVNGMPGMAQMPGGPPFGALSPAGSSSHVQTPMGMMPHSPAQGGMPYATGSPSPANQVHPGSIPPVKPKGKGGRPRKNKDVPKPAPPPIHTGTPVPSAGQHEISESSGTAKRKKKEKKGDKATRLAETSASTTPLSDNAILSAAHAVPEPPVERPPTPKRARYRVEYRPIHKPQTDLGGWDANMVAATFAKNSLTQGTRPIHDLAIVDMEAILMSLRSRLPHELGYAITVLSMLSMSHPEENIQGLPLHHLREIFQEILDLIGECAFGADGWDAWTKEYDHTEKGGRSSTDTDGDSAVRITASSTKADLDNMSFLELEQLGRDFDFLVDEDEEIRGPRDQTGGQTDIVLAGFNLLKNFSMFNENQAIMASFPEVFELLANVCNARLCRLPGQGKGPIDGPKRPFSILELARLRRDAVIIISNIGPFAVLRSVSSQTTVALFRLMATFLNSGFESLTLKEPIFGPAVNLSLEESPPPMILSISRALDGFYKLTSTDFNREAMGSKVPSSELVRLFESLIKLFPLSARGFQAMHASEDCLAYYECLSLALYSLVFLSPVATRATMRSVPGAKGILCRVIFDTALQKTDFKGNPFGISCRRLCETLGVLNGTITPNGQVEGGMSFSAGGIDGPGWKFASKKVQSGYLATYEEEILGVITEVRGMDLPAFDELEGMCWGSD